MMDRMSVIAEAAVKGRFQKLSEDGASVEMIEEVLRREYTSDVSRPFVEQVIADLSPKPEKKLHRVKVVPKKKPAKAKPVKPAKVAKKTRLQQVQEILDGANGGIVSAAHIAKTLGISEATATQYYYKATKAGRKPSKLEIARRLWIQLNLAKADKADAVKTLIGGCDISAKLANAYYYKLR